MNGLDYFCDHYRNWGIKSIAFPPLGCGNGGLEWSDIGPHMYSKLNGLGIEVEVYAPYGTDSEMIKEDYLRNHIEDAVQEIKGKGSIKLNKYWYLILYVVQKLNQDEYSLNVGRTIFQKICFVLTRTGIPTGFHFSEGFYGPYSPEVKEAINALSNANLMNERQLGKMVETIVNPRFRLNKRSFTTSELKKTNATIDLLSRIKNTDQAEMISTVLFTFDELNMKNSRVTEKEIVEHIHQWKKWWENTKDNEIIETIGDLASLGWISPDRSHGTVVQEEDLY